MSDVLLFQTPDDGDIAVGNGIVATTDGTESAVYISLFGGNYDGTTWWGDTFEAQENQKLKSETQRLLESMPLTTSGLQRILDAVKSDLSWMATPPTISVAMPALNTVKIEVNDIILTWSK